MNYSQYFILFVYVIAVISYGVSNNKTSKLVNQLCSIIMFLMFVLVFSRSDTMADYKSYIDDFSRTSYSLSVEPTFNFIKYIVQTFFKTFYAGFAIYALLSLGLRFHYIRKYPKIALACVMVYISNFLVLQDMIAIRSAVASALLLYLIDAKYYGKDLKCLIIIITAVCFHYSAILFFIIFFIDSHRPHRPLFILAILLSYITALSGFTFAALVGELLSTGIIPFHFNNYVNDSLNIFNLLQIGHIVICIFSWYKIKIIIKRFPKALLFLKLYTIALCILPLFSDFISVGIRMSELFLSVEIVLVPMIFSSSIKNRTIQKSVLIAYSAIIFYMTLTNDQYWDIDRYNYRFVR